MKAWHFVGNTLRDGRPVPEDGERLMHDGPVVMCKSGLHYSEHPLDALEYAPGLTLCRVEVSGIEETQPDKGVCRERVILRRVNAKSIIIKFATWCADRAKNHAVAAAAVAADAYAAADPRAADYAAYAATAADYAAYAADYAADASDAAAADYAAYAAAYAADYAAYAAAWAAGDAAWAAYAAECELQRKMFIELAEGAFREAGYGDVL